MEMDRRSFLTAASLGALRLDSVTPAQGPPPQRRFLIDTDTASDDAVALLMALRWPDVQVDALTIVVGNVPVEIGSRNAGYVAEICGKDTPVYIGCDRPLLREPRWA